MKADYVDFNYVPPHQEAMHDRLNNWARWVRVRGHGWQTHPMFRQAKTPKTLDVDAHISTALDTLDALLIERTVSRMPEKHKEALRWHYVRASDPLGMARKLAVSRAGLLELVIGGRTMVGDRATVTL